MRNGKNFLVDVKINTRNLICNDENIFKIESMFHIKITFKKEKKKKKLNLIMYIKIFSKILPVSILKMKNMMINY